MTNFVPYPQEKLGDSIKTFWTVWFIVLLSIGFPLISARGEGPEADVVRSLVIDGNESFSEQRLRVLMRTDVSRRYR